jgi:hypothetical protein
MDNYKIVISPLIHVKIKNKFWKWSIYKNDEEICVSKHKEGKNSKEECLKLAKEIADDLNIKIEIKE